MPAGEVVVSTVVALPLDRAFAVFTEEIDRWWQRTSGDDRNAVIRFEGDRLVAVSASGAEVLATVSRWSPPERVDLDWHGPHSQPGDTVVIELEPEPEGTRVKIRHRRGGLAPASAHAAIIGLWWGDVARRFTYANSA